MIMSVSVCRKRTVLDFAIVRIVDGSRGQLKTWIDLEDSSKETMIWGTRGEAQVEMEFFCLFKSVGIWTSKMDEDFIVFS